ncbi:MAG: FAD-dependent oxidoreductase [Acidobacteriaceae bacterium]
MEFERLQTTCCIVGGGPAGMMLGYLLGRAGVAVMVLEKHQDFFRDFSGDTVHPSTLEVMYELGLLEEFLKMPHQELEAAGVVYGDFATEVADFRHLPTHCKFIALMPQWDLLDFLAQRAKRFPSFDLRMRHTAVGITSRQGRVTGVDAETPEGSVHISADLVIGCDGRHSALRRAAQFEVIDRGVPIDVLWFRLSRNPRDPEQSLGNINYGKALVLINRGDYYQIGMIIAKGSFEQIKGQGIEEFRQSIARTTPFLKDRVEELRDWQEIKLLSVQINRLRQWFRPGLLCIGDAAHAMSPAGGVGINLAIQDAVASANLLAAPLRNRRVTAMDLARVQRRREFPTRVTQGVQVNAHKMLGRVFRDPGPLHAPWQLKAAVRIPGMQRLLGRAVGMGVRPEHVRDPRRRGARASKSLVMCAGALAVCALGVICIVRNGRRMV